MGNCFRRQNILDLHVEEPNEMTELFTEVQPNSAPLRCQALINSDTYFSKNDNPKSNEYERQYITNERLSNSSNSSCLSHTTSSPEQILPCQFDCRNCYTPMKSPMLPNDLEMHDVEYGFEPNESGETSELITEVRPMPTPLRCPDLITPDRKIETLFTKNGRPRSNEYVRQYISNKRLSCSGNSFVLPRTTISPEQSLLCQFDEWSSQKPHSHAVTIAVTGIFIFALIKAG